MMKGWYEGYSYVGIMPDGRKIRFATEEEYADAYKTMCVSNEAYRVEAFFCVSSIWIAKHNNMI